MSVLALPRRRARARPSSGLQGRLRPPGDKSISHRALILGGLAEGVTRIEGILDGDDVRRTRAVIEALGARVETDEDGAVIVKGVGPDGFSAPIDPLDFGNSGTGCRLMMGAIAGHAIEATLVGDESLSRRPMERVLEPLRAMGAVARADGDGLPVYLRGRPPLRAIAWISPVASAQVKSAVLLAGLAAQGVTEFVEPKASRDHTERMLEAFGVEVESESEGAALWRRVSGPITPTATEVDVPGDPSSAAFLATAALITRDSAVTLDSVLVNPTRTGALETLYDMGGALSFDEQTAPGLEPVATITASSSELKGLTVPPDRAPRQIDEIPILAVAAACAKGKTVMRGLSELRHKESDRIDAVAAMLKVNGVKVRTFDDGLEIEGCGPKGPKGGGKVATHGDHRIAMSALVLGLAARKPVEIDDARMIATSYPGFFQDLKALRADVEGASGRGARK